MPPLPDPIEPGLSVRNSKLMAEAPFLKTSRRILSRGIIANITQAIVKIVTTLLRYIYLLDDFSIISLILFLCSIF